MSDLVFRTAFTTGDPIVGQRGYGALVFFEETSGPVEEVAPVVSNFSPALGAQIRTNDTLSFELTISDGTPFANISINILFTGLGIEEGVYDGLAFSDAYRGSWVEAITNGYRFHLTRRVGWPASPKAKVRAVSATGMVNA